MKTSSIIAIGIILTLTSSELFGNSYASSNESHRNQLPDNMYSSAFGILEYKNISPIILKILFDIGTEELEIIGAYWP